MKFKDKDGNVFASMGSAYAVFCCNRVCESEECALYELTEAANIECMDWAIDHPTEAARLMGYEVVEDESEKGCHNCGRFPKDSPPCGYADDCYTPPNDPPSAPSHWTPRKETNMDKQKPRICEVLGVEVGERFVIDGHCQTVEAFWITEKGLFETDPPRFPGTSYAMMCAINQPELVIRNPCFTEEEVADAKGLYKIWPDAVVRRKAADDLCLQSHHYGFSMPLPCDRFLSIRPGQSVKLSEIVGGAE